MKKTELYPLQFVPQYKSRLWGGKKFNTLFNRNVEGHPLGESWEVSGLKKCLRLYIMVPSKDKAFIH